MKKNITTFITMLIILGIATMTVFATEIYAPGFEEVTEPTTTISEAYIPSETSIEEEVIILENVEVERVEPTTLDEANSLLEIAMTRKTTILIAFESLVALGYEEDHPALEMLSRDFEVAELNCDYYIEQQAIFQEEYEWSVRASEYPVATQAWLYMKNEFGWNDIVCAGIIGNLMAECGGCWTGDLNWQLDGPGGFGMIQWVGERQRQLVNYYGYNPSVEDQLNFMKDELYGTNGVTKQVTDSQLSKIMNASTPEECAFAFATYFERCAECYRAPRRGYARTAYEYFVG